MAIHPLIQKVSENIIQHHLCQKGDSLLISVSGGSDSVALLLILLELQSQWQYHLNVLHFDHGLRPESATERQFVQGLARQYGLPFYAFSTSHLAEASAGIQEKSRQWRLLHSEKIRNKINAMWIATAHHQDDQMETLLLKLLRGSHLSNLRGMDWKNGTYIRPLLNCTKTELQQYLKSKSQTWKEDPSNSSFKYLRNRIRWELLPLMNQLAKGELTTRLGDLSHQSMQLKQWIAQEKQPIEAHWKQQNAGLFVEELTQLPVMVQSDLLYQYLLDQGVKTLNYGHLCQILHLLQGNQSQWALHLPGKKVIKREGEKIFIEAPPLRTPQKVVCQSIEITSYLGTQWSIQCDLLEDAEDFSSEGLLLFNIAPHSRLSLCYRKAGDRFHPHWKQKPLKLKDFLRDQGIPLHQRNQIPLVCQNNQILGIYPHFRNKSSHFNENKFPCLHIQLKFLG